MEDKVFKMYQPLEEDKLRNYKFQGSRYYDYPDGEDLLGKLVATNRWAALLGLGWGLGNVGARPYCKSYKQMFFLCLYRTVPPVLITSAFTITTYYATRFRKVDDIVNHALGGMAAGGVIGTLLNNTTQGLAIGTFIAALASINKAQKMQNYPTKKRTLYVRNRDPYYDRKFNFTFVKEREKLWKKEPISPVN